MITAKDIDKEVELLGIVIKIRKPYIRIKKAKFDCPSCGSIISIIQEGKKLKEPKRCSCGRKGGFIMFEHEETEGQEIYVLEKGTEFGYIVFLEEPELIRKLTVIQEECAVKVTGIVKVNYYEKSAIGDLVIFANKLEQITRRSK